MIDPNTTFYVVTVGRSFLRYTDLLIIGQHLEGACRFDTLEEAVAARDFVRAHDFKRKPVGIQKVSIETV